MLESVMVNHYKTILISGIYSLKVETLETRYVGNDECKLEDNDIYFESRVFLNGVFKNSEGDKSISELLALLALKMDIRTLEKTKRGKIISPQKDYSELIHRAYVESTKSKGESYWDLVIRNQLKSKL